MPVGAPFESHVEPYSQIRVDDFTNTTYRPAWVNLLSHIHSDHTQGLSTPSFSSQVVCSKDSKSMLLLLESVDNRIRFDNGAISQRKRTFAALQRGGKGHRDLLLTLPLDTPTKLDIGPSESAIVTLLDANHCPGSVMCAAFAAIELTNIADVIRNPRFLIEGKRGAILHTGDMRAEPAMVSRLSQDVHIAPYLYIDGQQKKQLQVMYLDTASFIGTQIVPSKAEAVEGLVNMIAMYPEDTLFYLNIWTWGYEDILLGISERFKTKIHVDRHKYLVLCSVEHYISSPSFGQKTRSDVLKHILTCDEHETRFHACERYNQCATIKPMDLEPKRRTHRNIMAKKAPIKRVVWINPGVVSSSNWESYIQEVNDQLKEGQFVDTLKVPLSRHSTLTELQSFVSLLRPKNIYPTTISPLLEGLDLACIPGIFAEHLGPDGYERLRLSMLEELRKRYPGIDLTPEGMAKRVEQVLNKVGHPDLEQENAVGSDEIEWTEARFQRATKTKEHIETYLPWLFGRQDAPVSEAPQAVAVKSPIPASTELPASPPTPLLPVIPVDPSQLCSTCANCPTCRPKPPIKSPRVEVRRPETPPKQIDPGHPPLNDISSSSVHIVDPNAIPVQRNEQMYSPPQSPELRPHLEPASAVDTTDESSARPKKRLRTGSFTSPSRNSTPVVRLPEAIESPTRLLPNRTQTTADPGVSRGSIRSMSNTGSLTEAREHLVLDSSSLNDSRKVPRRSPMPKDKRRVPSVCPTETVAEHPLNVCSPRNTQQLGNTAVVSSTSTGPSTKTTETVTPLSESDTRERRRISKLKEQDIRAQLAKLPPGFSQALAATKSATKS